MPVLHTISLSELDLIGIIKTGCNAVCAQHTCACSEAEIQLVDMGVCLPLYTTMG